MSVITLISDWQPNSIYLSAVKGQLFSKITDAKIVDISHSIDPFNINQAAFILKNTFKSFPEKTIHLVCISSETKANEDYVIIFYENHYFVGSDNGIFGLIFDHAPNKIVKVNINLFDVTTFPELSIFVNIAVKISNEEQIETLGELTTSYKKLFPLSATYDEDVIQGKVIYIDAFKNAVSNISKELFEQTGKGRKFSIFIKSNRNKIDTINKKYSDSESGEIFAIFNSMNLLEFGQFKGCISELLAIDIETVIRVNFYK